MDAACTYRTVVMTHLTDCSSFCYCRPVFSLCAGAERDADAGLRTSRDPSLPWPRRTRHGVRTAPPRHQEAHPQALSERADESTRRRQRTTEREAHHLLRLSIGVLPLFQRESFARSSDGGNSSNEHFWPLSRLRGVCSPFSPSSFLSLRTRFRPIGTYSNANFFDQISIHS